MSEKHPNKFQWFINAEDGNGYNVRTFKMDINYQQIKTVLNKRNYLKMILTSAILDIVDYKNNIK